ncbi:hypothetical protein QUC31_019222 [Theobroma cacao]|uniref:C2H2-type domain-containing protein n=1 Tax=Theobroma cacao TaxID=3641 RepID=A0A061GTP1_THECC|nr:Uncharacterized protein TCM_040898 [Theobroma cacao]
MVPGDTSLDFLAQKLNAAEIIKLLEECVEAPDQSQDPTIRVCRYCHREFKSAKALGGHLRIHSQHQSGSKAGIHHLENTEFAFSDLDSQQSSEEDNAGFTCFVCDDGFSSLKLLCQHMRNHREEDYNGIQQPTPPQESTSLSEPQTTVEEGIDEVSPGNDHNQGSSNDLLSYVSNWSATGKRGRKQIDSDKIDGIIYNAVPLRVFYGSQVPWRERRLGDFADSNQSLLKRKKQKTRLSKDVSIESQSGAANSYKTDSEATVEVLGNSEQTTKNSISMATQRGFESRISSKSISRSSHGKLKKPKRAKAVNGVHQCEICGKTFQTGQALGGHKTYHRVKPVVDPSRGVLVQRKAEEQLSGESGQVSDGFSRMPLPRPGELSGEAHPSAQSNQRVTKRLLDFDLNIPYRE